MHCGAEFLCSALYNGTFPLCPHCRSYDCADNTDDAEPHDTEHSEDEHASSGDDYASYDSDCSDENSQCGEDDYSDYSESDNFCPENHDDPTCTYDDYGNEHDYDGDSASGSEDFDEDASTCENYEYDHYDYDQADYANDVQGSYNENIDSASAYSCDFSSST